MIRITEINWWFPNQKPRHFYIHDTNLVLHMEKGVWIILQMGEDAAMIVGVHLKSCATEHRFLKMLIANIDHKLLEKKRD